MCAKIQSAVPGKVLRPQNIEKFVSEQKCWHHLFVSIQPPELCGCSVLLPFLKMFCLTPRQANHTENRFSNSKYPHTLAGDRCKGFFSVSWEKMGINHQNGSVNVITQYHHHTIIPPNLDHFSSWATTWRKAGKLQVSDQTHVFYTHWVKSGFYIFK